jgi:16S rRNA (adenine1518-N6/adenine1519-N6)-dimethyltransferase
VGAVTHRPRKRFGQHFLANPAIATQIVTVAGVRPGERVLEVGPGLGVLTAALLTAGARVVAVELDRDLAAHLRSALPSIELVEGSALSVPLPDCDRVVANLPYNVGTAILLRLLDLRRPMTLMFQREVADRLTAGPGSRDFGSLSVHVQVRASARAEMALPPGAFTPPPRVHSSVVSFVPVEADFGGVSAEAFDAIVRRGFSQRRKTLLNALGAGMGREQAAAVLAAAAVDPGARAETVDLAGWRQLAGAAARGGA